MDGKDSASREQSQTKFELCRGAAYLRGEAAPIVQAESPSKAYFALAETKLSSRRSRTDSASREPPD